MKLRFLILLVMAKGLLACDLQIPAHEDRETFNRLKNERIACALAIASGRVKGDLKAAKSILGPDTVFTDVDLVYLKLISLHDFLATARHYPDLYPGLLGALLEQAYPDQDEELAPRNGLDGRALWYADYFLFLQNKDPRISGAAKKRILDNAMLLSRRLDRENPSPKVGTFAELIREMGPTARPLRPWLAARLAQSSDEDEKQLSRDLLAKLDPGFLRAQERFINPQPKSLAQPSPQEGELSRSMLAKVLFVSFYSPRPAEDIFPLTVTAEGKIGSKLTGVQLTFANAKFYDLPAKAFDEKGLQGWSFCAPENVSPGSSVERLTVMIAFDHWQAGTKILLRGGASGKISKELVLPADWSDENCSEWVKKIWPDAGASLGLDEVIDGQYFSSRNSTFSRWSPKA